MRTKIFERQFRNLRWQLLGSYLVVISTILVISDVLVYQFFSHSLYQQLDERLLNLAQAAAHSLKEIKYSSARLNYSSSLFDHEEDDGDLDIPWENLRQPSESVEWFAADKKRLAQAGTLSLNLPIREGFQTLEGVNKIRTVTIAVYSDDHGQQTLVGFIRASESAGVIAEVLEQLRWGCYLGGITALGLIGIGGMGLTHLALKPVEKSFQQLKQFTADVSHELRSPLTVIKTSVEVIQTHPERIHPADADKLKGIVSATNQMSTLVEDLLWLARSDAALEMPSQEWMVIPLDELVEDTIEFFDIKAEAKNITLNFDGVTSVSLRGEPSQLRRLFSNLLDNAIKYTPNGGLVTLTLKEVDKFAVIKVEDTGLGIAREHLPLVLNRFWRKETARSYQDGTGLGLAIAQAIVQNHGGEITITSKLGIGTCVKVCLPIHIGH